MPSSAFIYNSLLSSHKIQNEEKHCGKFFSSFFSKPQYTELGIGVFQFYDVFLKVSSTPFSL